MGEKKGTAYGWVVDLHLGTCGYFQNDAMLLHMFMQERSHVLLYRCLGRTHSYDKLGRMQTLYKELEIGSNLLLSIGI